MSQLTKLLAVGTAVGTILLSGFAASAADIQGSATYELVPLPPQIAADATTPVAFGQRYIPNAGNLPNDYVIDAAGTGGGQGSVTVSGATDGANYSVALSPGVCPDNVSFTPTAAYGGTTVDSGNNFTFADGTTTLSLGGTLRVSFGATTGEGSCTFTVSVNNV